MRRIVYTNTGRTGLHVSYFDPERGSLATVGRVADAPNAAFFEVHSSRRFLYAVNQLSSFKGKATGAVSAFAIDGATGELTHLNTVSSEGAEPCFAALDRRGKNLLVANYGGGSISIFPCSEPGYLAAASSSVTHYGSSIHPTRQSRAFPHSVRTSPDDRFVIVADLGMDRLIVYAFDPEQGQLDRVPVHSHAMQSGAGPRHFVFHPAQPFAYVVNELNSTITVLSWDCIHGKFGDVQTVSALPAGFDGENLSAEICAHPNGRFLYASNRGHNSIAVFRICPDGTVKLVQHVSSQGKSPRSFTLDPSGNYLFAVNQCGVMAVFTVNEESGRLEITDQRLELDLPVCVRLMEAVEDGERSRIGNSDELTRWNTQVHQR